MKKQRDPQAKKAKNNARQRKISANSSDKASRRNAPLIKARANRAVRRSDKQAIASSGGSLEESAGALTQIHKAKKKHWGSINAAERRAYRDKERAFLDSTSNHDEKGRRRSRFMKD